MEKTVKGRDAIIARHQEEKSALSAKILDLERQCSELAGRRKEREEAYEELQQKLAAHLAQTEQLKAENANRLKEAELATKQAVDRQRHIESLERGIERRDESVAALTAEIEQGKVSIGELTAARAKLDKARRRARERTRRALATGAGATRGLARSPRTAARRAGPIGGRTTHLASGQEALDQKSRQIERLTNELHDVAEGCRADSRRPRDARAPMRASLGACAQTRSAEAEKLKVELASQHQLVASLETELRSKQATRISSSAASIASRDFGASSGRARPTNEWRRRHERQPGHQWLATGHRSILPTSSQRSPSTTPKATPARGDWRFDDVAELLPMNAAAR